MGGLAGRVPEAARRVDHREGLVLVALRPFGKRRRAGNQDGPRGCVGDDKAVAEGRVAVRRGVQRQLGQAAAQATLLGFGFLLTGPQVKIMVAPKDQLRILTRRSWRVLMEFRIGRLNGSPPAGWPTSGSRTPNRCSAAWTDSCAAACGRCAGRNGTPPLPSGTTCGYAVSLRAAPGNGAAAARDTGGLRDPRSSRCPCPTPTGTALA
jgi:hypothetical protein